MVRDLLERFAYRYQLWVGETQGGKVGAGEAPPEISPKRERWWRMVVRFLWGMIGGLILLVTLGCIAGQKFPSFNDGIRMIVIYLAIIWCGV
jgi:hypothetical protein